MRDFSAGFEKSRIFLMVFATAVFLSLAVLVAIKEVEARDPATASKIQQGTLLKVTAPRSVEEGQPIKLTFSVENARRLAGYEVGLGFDESAMEFNGLTEASGLGRNGNVSESLGVVEATGGVWFGEYSCSGASCDDASNGDIRGVSGVVPLATVNLLPKKNGRFEIALDKVTFVDGSGKPLKVRSSVSRVVVNVGSGGTRYAAGSSSKSPARNTPSERKYPFDLTGDGRVTHADVMEVATAWEEQRRSGLACRGAVAAGRDVNRNGCVDIGDVQSVSDNYREARRSDYNEFLSSMSASDGGRGTYGTRSTSQVASAIVVNSTGDQGDARLDGRCSTSVGTCTLRAAITESNARAGADRIEFDIPGNGVQTINIASALPTINDETGSTEIDGYTQPGATPNTDPLVSNANIKIEIVGTGENNFGGLMLTSPGNTVRGISLYKLKNAVRFYGTKATGNSVLGSFVGTDAAGLYFATVTYPGSSGVHIQAGAQNNRVGDTSLSGRNVISGNAHNGVATYDNYTNGTVVVNNLVGLSPDGKRRVPNRNHGVDLNTHTSNSIVGGTGALERNVVSGNGYEGIEVSHGTRTKDNQIVGNFIGTDVTGTQVQSHTYNVHFGIHIEDAVQNNTFTNNVIGGNRSGGIQADGYSTSKNVVSNNLIGISSAGVAIPNGGFGVRITYHANGMKIGPENVIANNPVGIVVTGDPDNDFNTITRNSIYQNTGLGIDLAPLGAVNPNDAGDKDSGPNDQLNFPVLTRASTGYVAGSACSGCVVEVFVSDGLAEEHGEGKTFAGTSAADASGAFEVPVSVRKGDIVSATVTDASGNTSEFSRNMLVEDVSPPQTEIESGPEGLTRESTPVFEFSGTDESSEDLVFSFRLDNGDWSQYTSDTSATFTESIPDGQHVFEVRAKDAAGNVDPTPASREFEVDSSPPEITATVPSNDEEGVRVDSKMTISFSEELDASTVTSDSIFLRVNSAGQAVESQISYDAQVNEVTLTPNQSLEKGAEYSLIARGGAAGLRDLAGNPMVEDRSVRFVTEQETPPPVKKLVFSEGWAGDDGSRWNPDKWRTALVNGEADISGGEGRMNFQNVPNSNVRVISRMESRSDTEILMSFRFASNDPRGYLKVFSRSSGDWVGGIPSSGYSFEIGNDRRGAGLRKLSSGTITELANAPVGEVTNNKQWLRFRIEGSVIQAKVWTEGEVEPTNWEIQATDDTFAGAGVMQMRWGYSNVSSVGGRAVYMDDLEVADLD